MGGARLKSKYQTKEVYRSVQPGNVSKTGKTKKVSKKVKKRAETSKDNSIVDIKTSDSSIHQKMMMMKRQQGSDSKHNMRRNISGIIKAQDVRRSN